MIFFYLEVILIITNCVSNFVSNEEITDLSIFSSILPTNSSSHYEIILCGNFTNFFHQDRGHTVTAHHQTALIGEGRMEHIFDKIPQKLTDSLLLFFIVPSSLEEFFQILEKLTIFYANSRQFDPMQNPRMVFFSWPKGLAEIPHHQNISSILTHPPKMNKRIQEIILKIPQNEQVYTIMPSRSWSNLDRGGNQNFEKVSPSSLTNYGLLELYGIEGRLPVLNLMEENPNYGNERIALDKMTEFLRIGSRRRNFQNITLKILAEPAEDYKIVVDVEILDDGRVIFKGGAGVNILTEMQQILNFSYTAVAGKGWTSLGPDGQLQGMGGQIVGKEADLSISSNLLQVNRSKHIWFLQPGITEEVLIFYRQPPSTRNIFSLSFSNELWYVIFGTFGILCGATFLVLKTNYSAWENFYAFDIPFWILSTLCQQGWNSSPTSPPSRVIFITTMMASLILYNCYTAAFIAKISIPDVPIKGYSDLAKYGMEAFMDATISDYAYYFAPDHAEVTKIVETSKKEFKDEGDALDRVMESGSKLALIIPIDQFYTAGNKRFSDSQLCSISFLRGRQIARTQSAMFIRKWADYKEFFEMMTIFLMERGLNRRHWGEYKRNTRLECHQADQQSGQRLDFWQCYFAFLVIFAGTLLAFGSFLAENFFARRKPNCPIAYQT